MGVKKRYFQLEDEKSHKFWEIETKGASHTVRFGRIGTDGQKKTKEFSSAAEAMHSSEKLIQQKKKKGYQELPGSRTYKETERSAAREAPMNKGLLLKRCCEFAGGSGTWSSDDLDGFFHQFRPSGKDLAKIYDGVEHGDAVMKRIKAAMKVDGTTKGSMLAATNPTAVDDKEAAALVRKLLTNVQSLAKELNEDELAEMFVASDFVMKTGQRGKYRQNNLTQEPHNVMCEVADGIMFGNDSAAAVMFEAVYTLVHDFPLAYYIQWPIYASEFKTKDPFKPFYDLWVRNVAWRFIKGQVVEIYTP